MNANISIIVPVYNAEKTLHRCVNSIINQSYKCWELLLVNDGSTDNSATICDEYALLDKRIKVFHKKNEGVSCARNVGVDNATGEWITFVDSDDWLDSEALFYYKQEEDVDLVLSAIFSHEKGKCNKIILEKMKCHQLNTIGRVLSLLNNYVGLTTPWAKLLKKSILLNHNLRFDEKIVSGEDTLFIYKYLYYINSISCVNKAC